MSQISLETKDNSEEKIKYNFKEITIRDFSKYKNKERKEIIIVKEYEETGAWIPSQLTSYLKTVCNNLSINSKAKEARYIVNFLNYLKEEVSLGYNPVFNTLRNKGLYGLNFYHLAEFLTSLQDVNKYETVKDKENILLKFYDYLHKIGVTGEDAKVERIAVPVKSGEKRKQVKWQIVNPFNGNPDYHITYPDTEGINSEVLKDMDEDIWNLFLDYARKHHKNIALGVAFQICGGLRQGEIVNLTINAVKLNKDKNHLTLSIMDRQSELFDRGVDTRYSQVKKPREDQPVFNFNGELFDIWDEHLEYLKNNKKIKNKSALFVDSNGQAITAQVYQKEFHKLKWNFIKYLEDECNKIDLANEYREKSWGSHIGRHIFTNYLIKKGYLKNIMGYSDPKLLMILRGDSSVKSSEAYLDLKAITESVADGINIVSSIASSMPIKNRDIKEY
ncbi:MAG: site-specific integrase [Clostridium sp.]|nr:site-specific integrase [Clostridium sp.]